MIEFPLHTLSTAPAPSRAILSQAGSQDADAANLIRTLAESPAALAGFQNLRMAFAGSSLRPVEQEVVYLTAAQANACHYCTSLTGAFDDSPEAEAAADAIRGERVIRNPRLQALRRFTLTVTDQHGWVSESEVEQFLAAGFTRAQVLEVISGVALATLSSYVNHIAATPIEGDRFGHPLDA